jgi:hypothetical protein
LVWVQIFLECRVAEVGVGHLDTTTSKRKRTCF